MDPGQARDDGEVRSILLADDGPRYESGSPSMKTVELRGQTVGTDKTSRVREVIIA